MKNFDNEKIYYYLLYGNIADNNGKLNLNISDEFQKKLLEIVKSYMNKVCDNDERIVDYNQIGNNDGEIETLNLENSPYDKFYTKNWFDSVEDLHTDNEVNIGDFT